jgi:hypothetical protein
VTLDAALLAAIDLDHVAATAGAAFPATGAGKTQIGWLSLGHGANSGVMST